jgi:DNA-binding IclR family transcriptional regulator
MSASPLFIAALEKGMAALAAFRSGTPSMNLPELARACGISTSAAQRVAYTLEQLGYLKKDERTRRYSLSVRAMSLGYEYLMTEPLFQRAHAILHELNQRCGESVNLSVRDGDNMVFVVRIHTHKHIPVYLPIGKRIPVFCTASGRAVLSALAPEVSTRMLLDAPRQSFTPSTTTDPDRLIELVADAARLGYAYADEEYFRGDLNVAAPVLDQRGEPVAAVNISVPTPRWSLAQACQELGPLAVRAARAINEAVS